MHELQQRNHQPRHTRHQRPELAGVTFSDSESCSKIIESVLDSNFFLIWDTDSCSASGNHRCNRNSATFVIKQWHLQKPHRLLPLPKIKSDPGSGSGFFTNFLTPLRGPKKNTMFPDSTPALQIRGHLWTEPSRFHSSRSRIASCAKRTEHTTKSIWATGQSTSAHLLSNVFG